MSTATAALPGTGRTIAGAEQKPTFAAKLRRAWAEYWAHTVTVAELQSLSTRQLRAAGLRRQTIRPTAV